MQLNPSRPAAMRMVAALLLVFALAFAGTGAAFARDAASNPKAAPDKSQWPHPVTTRHAILIDGKELRFSATAGYITLRNAASGKEIADIAYIAFTRDAPDKANRPVTFAFNGGPGYASAWLNLGAMGPWRLPLDQNGAFPTANPTLSDNRETWLGFTDLVFIDPAGTGYGRIDDQAATEQLWSVNGDISSIATVIRRWSEKNGRTVSPKYLAGESYGGFRAPKIAHVLQSDQGVGVAGLVLVSPVLDFGRRRNHTVLNHAALLPSMAATAMGRKGPVTPADLAPVETYARGDFVVDLLKGRKDTEAIARLSERVSKLTGLNKDLVALRAGRISASLFAREFWRDQGRVASMYDGLITGLDPDRYSSDNEAEDQLRLGLHAPLVQAMVGLYHERLKWVYPDGRYMFQNKEAGNKWRWGRRSPEAVSDLASTVALDPRMRVLVTHGMTDLVTPYFDTKMVLAQMPPIGKTERIAFRLYPGGHMFYSEENSRKAFRDDARAMIEGREGNDE